MSEHPAQTLGRALPLEMARVRDKLLPVYDALPGGVGKPAATMMRADLDNAARALAEGDLPAMVRAFNSLKGFKL